MTEAEIQTCSRCGRAIDSGTSCEICGQLLCHYDIRMLDGHMLCPRCYKEETFQYHSKECDIIPH
jgi:formylmethanofuran dehydrogenase subunit E